MTFFVLTAVVCFAGFGVGQFLLLGLPFPARLFALIPLMVAAAGAVAFWYAIAGAVGWDLLGYQVLMLVTLFPAMAGMLLGALARGVLWLVSQNRKKG